MSPKVLTLALLYLAAVVSSQGATLVSTNATWRFLRGTNEASLPDVTAWRGNAFNDAGFADAPAPFWYGDILPGGTQLTDMQNNYTCIFLRRTFDVTNVAEIGALRFSALIDDGFIAWINGTEVLRVNMPDAPGTAVTRTTLSSGALIDPAPFQPYDVLNPGAYLLTGANTIAVQVFNTTLASSDLGFDCSLSSILTETVPPAISSVTPPPGSTLTNLTQITVQFTEPVAGVSSDDLVIHGIGATGVSGGGATYTFTFAQAPAGEVPVAWVSGHGITDQAVPPNAFDAGAPGNTWNYTVVDPVPPTVAVLFPLPGATVQSLGQVEITFSENVAGVEAADLRINGQPATNVIAQPGAFYTFQFAQPPAGPVLFAWASGHAITDLAIPPNAFAGGTWTNTLNPNSGGGGTIVINEINANNQSGLRDEDIDPVSRLGEAQDWIELYNAGSTNLNLNGWSLSDDASVPGQWIFPARVLQPGQYLVVFASGKDRRAPTGTNRFHTNFKLSGGGEFLGLFNADSPRRLISGFPPEFPEQRNDNSYGSDAGGSLRYFTTPTPGAANGVSTITGVVDPVHFSSPRGHYTQPFNLLMTCPTPGASIRYTGDGSEPTAVNGQLYVGPLRLTNTFLLRAAAFRTNLLPSQVTSHSFFFNLSAADRALPTLSILTWSNNLLGRSGIIGMSGGSGPPNNMWTSNAPGDYYNPTNQGIAWERPMSVEFIRPEDNSGFQIDCGMRVQGSAWTRPRYLATSKFSYRLYFRGDYGDGRLEYPLLPTSTVQSFDQIVLRAGHNDETNPYLTDELVRQLSADMGDVACHGVFVNFFLNGVLKRYYNPTERVEEGFLQSWQGGSNSWDILTVGSAIQGGDNVAWNSMRTYANGQNLALPASYTEMTTRLDMTNFADYLILNMYGATWDWPHNNWRAARERRTGALFRFYIWDAEGAFGFTGRGPTFDAFTPTASGSSDPGIANNGSEIPTLYQRLRVSPEFRLLWADRVHKHFFNNGALTDTNITQRFLQMRAQLLPVIPGFNNNYLNTWIPQRRAPLMNQFNLYGLLASSNAPVFNQHGGRVPPGFSLTMAATAGGGIIHYTTDGSDPRVRFTGAVSNSAVAYAGPVTLNQSVLISARTLNGTNWSALSQASYQVATLGIPLRFTEVMYNPPDGPAYEFLELQNVGTAPVDLSAMHFNGVTYIFPIGRMLAAGARLVLASDFDPTAFALRYPGVTVEGYFNGSLANNGERITLLDASDNVILSLDYDNAAGWPVSADGGGRSLEIIDPNGDPDGPANWRASSQTNGSPGSSSAAPAPGSVQISEVASTNLASVSNAGTHPDWIELFNSGGVSVDLAGWSLSDDGNARKFVLPTGAAIAAGAYLVLWCDDATNTTPGLHTGFSLNEEGDNVFLYDAAGNRADAVTFGPQLPDYSVGRVGGAWQLTTPTPNAANAAAALASASGLVINEWMANALPGQKDWIELYNPAGLPAPLRGIYLGTTTTVHHVTSLSFIGAGGYAQLFADEGVGADRLDFKLPGTGSTIILSDPSAIEINRVSYGAQTEGLARGRLPDGSATLVNFPGSASPGAANYLVTYTGPVLNEVLARNQSAVTNNGQVADFVELFNPNGTNFPLAGLSLSVNSAQAGEWRFPPEASIPAGGYLVVWCDSSAAASTNAGSYNTGESLDGQSGGAWLFNPAGQPVNSVEYGFQVADRSIGLSGGQWRLLTSPTPGAANAGAAALGSISGLRLNEWMASPDRGGDWFEVYNPAGLAVDLNGLILTDDPTIVGQTNTRAAPLSFIGPQGFAKWVADGQAGDGRDHVGFSLDGQGDLLRLYSTNGTNFVLIDTIAFGAQALGVSQGRLPDGDANNIVSFQGSATPSEANYLLAPGVVISEVLTHTDPPLEDAIELRNTGGSPVDLGGWFLSNSQGNFKKYRIPNGSTLAPGGFVVFYEYQFNDGTANAFTLNSARGDELWLSAADGAGVLTGYRTSAKFGAAANGVSFGRHETRVGVDYAPMLAHSFGTAVTAQDPPGLLTTFRTGAGAANTAPLIGPVIINELMYHPPPGPNSSADDEYVELKNVTGAPVPLYDPAHPANTWKLTDGIEFTFPHFPQGVTLAAGGHLLLVNFDPGNPVALDAFRARYNIRGDVPVYGPYAGRLDNDSGTVDLRKPDAPQPPGAPDAGYVPSLLVDKLAYTDSAPWPSLPGGGDTNGLAYSLQRRSASQYGNDPVNWVASAPTPGAGNGTGVVPPPVITSSPQSQIVLEGEAPLLSAAATGSSGPLAWQWRFNGIHLPDATNATLAINYVLLENAGTYDAIVSNPGGSAISGTATLVVRVPPIVLAGPVSVYARPGTNIVFTVSARGSAPLSYQWRLNGVNLPGATGTTLARNNVQLADDGVYDVLITNPYATAIASATLGILINPVITQGPVPQTVVVGGSVTLSATVTGNPAPFTFDWRRSSQTLVSNIVNRPYDFFTFTATNTPTTVQYRVVVKNAANSNPGVASSVINITTLADGDGDGIPDVWESQFGLNATSAADRNLDSDGDGMSNWAEYIAGTEPTNALSYLKVDLSTLPGAATVGFTAVSNKTYTLQYSDRIEIGLWQKLADVLARTNNRVESITDPAWTTNRFYRAVTPRQP